MGSNSNASQFEQFINGLDDYLLILIASHWSGNDLIGLEMVFPALKGRINVILAATSYYYFYLSQDNHEQIAVAMDMLLRCGRNLASFRFQTAEPSSPLNFRTFPFQRPDFLEKLPRHCPNLIELPPYTTDSCDMSKHDTSFLADFARVLEGNCRFTEIRLSPCFTAIDPLHHKSAFFELLANCDSLKRLTIHYRHDKMPADFIDDLIEQIENYLRKTKETDLEELKLVGAGHEIVPLGTRIARLMNPDCKILLCQSHHLPFRAEEFRDSINVLARSFGDRFKVKLIVESTVDANIVIDQKTNKMKHKFDHLITKNSRNLIYNVKIDATLRGALYNDFLIKLTNLEQLHFINAKDSNLFMLADPMKLPGLKRLKLTQSIVAYNFIDLIAERVHIIHHKCTIAAYDHVDVLTAIADKFIKVESFELTLLEDERDKEPSDPVEPEVLDKLLRIDILKEFKLLITNPALLSKYHEILKNCTVRNPRFTLGRATHQRYALACDEMMAQESLKYRLDPIEDLLIPKKKLKK